MATSFFANMDEQDGQDKANLFVLGTQGKIVRQGVVPRCAEMNLTATPPKTVPHLAATSDSLTGYQATSCGMPEPFTATFSE
jgi:hypothetical protein